MPSLHGRRVACRIRPVLVCALFLAAAGANAQTPETTPPLVPDLLDLPATTTPHATGMLQLALARAGNRMVSVGENGTILLSDDNGATWRQARSVPVSVTLTDVEFAGAQQGWAVGHGGVILHSGDGGDTWQRQLDGTSAAQALVTEAQALQAAGAPGADAALRNAGYMVNDGPDKPFLDVSFADERQGWAVGAYGLAMETQDGGVTWHSITARLPNPGGKHLYRIMPFGDGLLVAGEQGSLFRADTRDGAFTAIDSPYEGTFFGLLPLADGGVLAFGLKGNAWRAAPGLTDWRRIDLGRDTTVTTGLRLADDSLLLGDEGGRLLRSTDEGSSFAAAVTPAGAGLTGIGQAGDGRLILTGQRGNSRLNDNPTFAEAR